MFRTLLIAAAVAASPAVPAVAQDSKPAAEAAPEKSKRVCRRGVATGSVIPKRVCRTQAEWDQITAQSQSDLDRTRDMERSRSIVSGIRGS